MRKFIWFFGGKPTEGGRNYAYLLGNKGAQLAEMAKAGIPVPPGFIITTEVSIEYQKNRKIIEHIPILDGIKYIEKFTGRKFGDRDAFPLLVSVRSGAPVSMPGMMDTILNVGITKEALKFFPSKRFALDTLRRFIQMFGSIVLGVPRDEFENDIERWKWAWKLGKLPEEVKGKSGVADSELPEDILEEICKSFENILKSRGIEFPWDPMKQLYMAIEAVFKSWNSERAISYRRIMNISDDLGTAVVVVAMVFGNMNERSGTGVLFTRDPNTGEKYLYGNFLPMAQGEDVVAGIRTPHAINQKSKSSANQKLPTLEEIMPKAYQELKSIAKKLEQRYKDMQDVEFTIENGKVWILQTRSGKRTSLANIKITWDMYKEKLINQKEVFERIKPENFVDILFPVVDEENLKATPIAYGIGASPGAVTGKVVFDPERAWEMREEKVILCRHETSPEDIKGMAAAVGILTARGGETSHAAVVARAMGKAAVVGAEEIKIDYESKCFYVGEIVVREGDVISIDGRGGRVFLGEVPKKIPSFSNEAKEILKLADKIRKLKIRANADTPEDARKAREFGAEGIGLLRTEHMYFKGDRVYHFRKAIILAGKYKILRQEILNILQELQKKLAKDLKMYSQITSLIRDYKKNQLFFKRCRKNLLPIISDLVRMYNGDIEIFETFEKSEREYFETILEIKRFIKEDFREIFKIMSPYPVTVRLLDPPLHEFLPKDEKEIEETSQKTGMKLSEIKDAIRKLSEVNPMLGHRGVRVGISYPEIYSMQAEAIIEAVGELIKNGVDVKPEIMLPNVIDPRELIIFREVIEDILIDVEKEMHVKIPLLIGTMIEFPRACIFAKELSKIADFFSFGTNDLTQTVLGISRDDSGKFMGDYIPQIFSENPFSTLDEGVQGFIKLAVSEARKVKKKFKIGVCGEHGGDPESIKFFHKVNFDYVSVSPFKVPIARISAAIAKIKEKELK